MSEKSEKLFRAIGGIGEDLADGAGEEPLRRKKTNWTRFAASAAAILIGVTAVAWVFARSATPAYAVAEAVYPESVEVIRETPERMLSFLEKSVPVFLGGEEGKNRVYSPVNLYVALGMLAECTAGQSRDQILSLLGEDDIEAQRAAVTSVWKKVFRDSDRGKCLLANSLWMNDAVELKREVPERLAADYYASTYHGRMGEEDYDRAFADWINRQTENLLADKIDGHTFNPRGVLTLASTVYFRGRWTDEFNKDDTFPGVFHSPAGDVTADFMHDSRSGVIFRGERFTAFARSFTMNATMFFLLPDEGVTPEELARDPAFLSLVTDWMGFENTIEARIELALPKFDVSSDTDLALGLQTLGVTDVFDFGAADFSPLVDGESVALTGAEHAARVAIDEEGCTAASYVLLEMDGAGAIMDEETVTLTFDRPFLFAVTEGNLPVFVGIVNTPAE
ncbi:MAG: hypothetical protein IK132_06410 [Clostridia bacterium]|nr:hypothetical protein [Clostridia bacterium]